MRAWVLMLVSACYAPKVQPGTPCTPEIANCPGDQLCALLDGAFVCVNERPGVDALATDTTIGEETDALQAQPDAATPKWTLVRTAGAEDNEVTFGATAAGNTIIVAIETTDNDIVDALTDNAGTAYTRIPTSRAIVGTEDLGIELWYARSSNAGATRITATGDVIYGVVMWEVAGLDNTAPLGNVTRLQDQDASGMPAGAPITTTTTGEFVVSVAIVGNVVNGLAPNSAFTNDQLTYGNGWAHLTSNTTAPGTFTARWIQPNAADYCATSAAFRLTP